MACIQTENFYFAIRKDTGEPVHISQMLEKDRGLDCNCVCAACKRSLVAKLGRGKRVRHFAHYAERDIVLDCSAQKANESGLHLMAKKIVKESTYINLPEIQISARRDSSRNEDDWEQLQPLIFEKKRKLQFSNAETEVRCDGFVPDIYIPIRDSVLLVEIAVTHYVDIEKYNRIKRAKVPTIEIDISDFLKNTESFSEDELRKELIDSVEHKRWIYHRREQEGIQKLCERNRKREIEYQAQCKREREREEQREKWIEEQKLHEQKTLELFDELEKDVAYYLSFSRKLINSEQALNEINRLRICDLSFSRVKDIPFYLNIPVFGEIAFNCDRRIWQTILFENFIYRRKENSVLQPEKEYFYFGNVQKNWLNLDFVHFWKKNFPEKSLLRCALEEYMIHLSGLGFIDRAFYRDANVYREYPVRRCTLEPENTLYAEFLKQALAQMPPTNNPFDYLQEGWIKKCYELEQQGFSLEE